MSDKLFTKKDNEFIAWYPLSLDATAAGQVWSGRRAAWYVHIPFCAAICHYCGFSVSKLREAAVERYLSALHDEIARYIDSGRLANHSFSCGHFGGGTPSVLTGSQLMDIKRQLDAGLCTTADPEVTVEVNPLSFTAEKARDYRDAGVNRISFGLQSFDDETLRVIGRPHRAQDVIQTLDVLRTVGFEDYSLDLMYCVPGQTMERLRADVLRAVDTGAPHISCFRLQIIGFTVLKLREATGALPPRLSVEACNEMDDLVTSLLTENGYHEYGAFNFAKPGYESVHNEIAFIAPQGEYVGFGNSSFSYINQHIYTNYAEETEYITAVEAGRDPIALARRVNAYEEMSRYFVLGIKFHRVPRAPFIARFGLEPEVLFGPVLSRLENAEYITREGDDYLLTRMGRHFINNVCKEFYVGDSVGRRQNIQFVPTLTPREIEHYAKKAERIATGMPEEVGG